MIHQSLEMSRKMERNRPVHQKPLPRWNTPAGIFFVYALMRALTILLL